jgi:putative phage-type endonuclease
MASRLAILLLLLLIPCSSDASGSPAPVSPADVGGRIALASTLVPPSPGRLSPGRGADRKADVEKPLTERAPSPLALRVLTWGDFDAELVIKKLYASLEVTEEGRRSLAALDQGSPEWLEARRNRLTGSNFGAAAGHNKWKSPAALAHDMLYSTFQGNDATRWGTAHEPIACSEYILARRAQLRKTHGDDFVFEVTHSGLNIDAQDSWMAVSPDGHVREHGQDAVLEIKCPFSKRPYAAIPPYYMDQLQGLMGVLSLPWADFCVWTPDAFQVTRVPFDARYWGDELRPALVRFYREVFLCAYVEKERRAASGDHSVPPQPR